MEEGHRNILLETASVSLRHGVEHGGALVVDVADYDEPLQRLQASFVTLRENGGSLRGCMGSSRALRPLIQDVALNAYAAGFLDSRFGRSRRKSWVGSTFTSPCSVTSTRWSSIRKKSCCHRYVAASTVCCCKRASGAGPCCPQSGK